MKDLDPTAVLVVTRPQPDADRLCEALRARGRQALAYPVIAIEPPADGDAVAAIMARVEDYRLVVFVSPNAIRAALARRAAPWPGGVTIGVMGPGSVATLAALGVRPPASRIVAPPTGASRDGQGDRFDSEALFAALEDTLGPIAALDGRALILRGNGGRAWFAERLRGAGVAVDELEVYRRVAAPSDRDADEVVRRLFTTRAAALFVVTSSEGIDRLDARVARSLAGLATEDEAARWLRAQPLLAPHRRIVDNAARLGFARVEACGPGDAGILAAIE